MIIKTELIVINWLKDKKCEGVIINLTLNSNNRKILRGKRFSDCNKELIMQLPREGSISDGDILETNQEGIFVKVKAMKENLLKISSDSNLDVLKAVYHLGNRHVEMELLNNYIFVKDDYVIENLLKNLHMNTKKIYRKFNPEIGAFKHG